MVFVPGNIYDQLYQFLMKGLGRTAMAATICFPENFRDTYNCFKNDLLEVDRIGLFEYCLVIKSMRLQTMYKGHATFLPKADNDTLEFRFTCILIF